MTTMRIDPPPKGRDPLQALSANTVILALTCLVLSPSASYAYLDPASVNMMLQSIATILVAAAFFLRAFWIKIKTVFSRGGSERK